MIDLNKTYKLRNEKRCKLTSQPRIMKVVEEDPGRAYALEAEWEDIATGKVSTEVWTAGGQYYACSAQPHDWDLVEAEAQTTMLDPAKKYRLRDPADYEVLNPIISAGHADAAEYPITARLRNRKTETVFWQTWTASGGYVSGNPDPHKMDLVEDVPEWHNWPIDAKVLCRDDDDPNTYKGYYAGEHNGRPTAWAGGATSWSAAGVTPCDWDEIKLAEPE